MPTQIENQPPVSDEKPDIESNAAVTEHFPTSEVAQFAGQNATAKEATWGISYAGEDPPEIQPREVCTDETFLNLV